MKGNSEEKCAQSLASRLQGPKFDIYLRLNEEDRKKESKIKKELIKEFEREKLHREEALFTLSNRTLNKGESHNSWDNFLVYTMMYCYS